MAREARGAGLSRAAAGHPVRAELLTRLAGLGGFLPEAALRGFLRASLAGRRLALCLHRIGDASVLLEPAMAACTIAASRLDRLIELLLRSRVGHERWLTVSFDDGYEDAARYVADRSARFPQADFLFFVCPEKTERGAGFRWDAADDAARAGRAPSPALAGPPGDVLGENDREELRALGRRDRYRLADLATVRALGELPNVALGNHTNGHFRPRLLSDEQARLEYAGSVASFERLFGRPGQLAFPFGIPYVDVEPRHVRIVAQLGVPAMWSTWGRPYAAEDVRPGALLPRFPIDGTKTHRELAMLVALRSAFTRVQRPRPFPS